VRDFAVKFVMATQPDSEGAHEAAKKWIRYGSSPRGAQALVESGRVLALMRGRLQVSIEDIQSVCLSVLRHRVILNFDAHADGQTADGILTKVIRQMTDRATRSSFAR
jgi:MoxR-like ATPase